LVGVTVNLAPADDMVLVVPALVVVIPVASMTVDEGGLVAWTCREDDEVQAAVTTPIAKSHPPATNRPFRTPSTY
jgi:hypothetical protein